MSLCRRLEIQIIAEKLERSISKASLRIGMNSVKNFVVAGKAHGRSQFERDSLDGSRSHSQSRCANYVP